MRLKWIPLLVPVSLLVIVTPVFCQSTLLSNTVAGSQYQQFSNVGFQTDTSRIAIPADSTFADLNVGWNKQPGQMPVYYPGILPNSMPVLSPPAVDEEMIITQVPQNGDVVAASKCIKQHRRNRPIVHLLSCLNCNYQSRVGTIDCSPALQRGVVGRLLTLSVPQGTAHTNVDSIHNPFIQFNPFTNGCWNRVF